MTAPAPEPPEWVSWPTHDEVLAREFHRLRLSGAIGHHALENARRGDRNAALHLLGLTAEAIADGAPIPPPVGDWLAGVLKSLSQGATIEDAAKVPTRTRGKKKEGDATRDRFRRYLIAQEYAVRTLYGERMKQEAAWREVAEIFGVDVQTVRAAWRSHRESLTRELAMSMAHTGKLMRIPIPAEFLAKLK